MESTEVIWQELKNLKHGYDDLRQEIANITSKKNEATQTSRRGALTTSGVTAERILKYIYKKEGKEAGGKPADKLMLDELISELSERAKPSILPYHVVTHLRTVQAWRNLGGHDKGDFSDVDDDTLIGVNIALNTVVSWFFENYLGGEYAELARNSEIKTASEETSVNLTEHEKIWQDYFWFANRNANIRAIEASYLNSLKVKFNLSEDRIENLKIGYQRKIAEFIELIEQALEDGKMEAFEAEAIEHAREACCVSVIEAKEIITSYLEKIQPALNDSEAHQITWLRDVFESKKGSNAKKEEKPRTIDGQSIHLERFLIAAEKDSSDAMGNIGVDGNGVLQDNTEALEWFLKAAENGEINAMEYIGYMHFEGIGVLKDYAKAMEWFLKAAENGSDYAMFNIGHFYLNGLGVSQDYLLAMQCFLKAAEKGEINAMVNIGYMHFEGIGVLKDYAKAMEWFLKAAENGSGYAVRNIGVMFQNGYGVTQDYSKAMECYQAAAELGSKEAMLDISNMYKDGIGVEKSSKKAQEWLEKSNAN